MARVLVPLVILTAVFAIACGGSTVPDPPTPTPQVDSGAFDAIPPTPVPTATSTPLVLVPPTTSASVSSASPPQSPGETPTALNLSPQWEVGQSWDYELIESRERLTGGVRTSLNSANSMVQIEVLEATPTGFVVGYTLKSIELPATGVPLADLLAKNLAELTVDVTYEIEVNPQAIMVGLRNFAEINESVSASIDRVAETIGQTASPEETETLQALFDQVRSTFETEENVLMFGLTDMSLYFLPFGWDLDIGDVYELEDTLPSPLGGPPIPASAQFWVTGSEVDDSAYTFNWSQGFSGTLAEQAMFESLMILSLQVGGPQPSYDDVRGIERTDAGVFALDTETWTLTSLEFSQRVTNQGAVALDETTLRLLP